MFSFFHFSGTDVRWPVLRDKATGKLKTPDENIQLLTFQNLYHTEVYHVFAFAKSLSCRILWLWRQ